MLSLLLSLWSPVEVRRELDHTVEEVFAAVADPHTYPRWLVGAQRMRDVDEGFPAPGTAFHHSVGPVVEATIDDSTSVRHVDVPHVLELEVHVGPLRGEVEFSIDSSTCGSVVRLAERPTGWAAIVTPLIRPALGARNALSLRRLDRLLANQRAVSPPRAPSRGAP